MIGMIVVETFPIRFMGLWLMGVYLVVPCIQIYLFIKDWKEKKKERNLPILLLSVVILAAGIIQISILRIVGFKAAYNYFGGEYATYFPTEAYVWAVVGYSTALALLGPILVIIKSISNKTRDQIASSGAARN